MIKCYICKNKAEYYKTINSQKIYQCKKCWTAIIPTAFGKVDSIYSFKEYDKRRKYFEKRFTRLIGNVTYFKKKGRVLDVGSGFGLFSRILNQEGKFNIELLDPQIKPYYFSTGILYKMRFENFAKKSNKKYDIILLIDVLEHFQNPTEILTIIHNKLNENGIVVIQTPNYLSLMAKIVKDWSWWMVEDHKLIFSIRSLTNILRRTHFKVIHKHTYEDLMDFKKNLDGNFLYIQNSIIRKLLKLVFFSFFLPTYLIARKIMWYFNLGASIFIIAKSE